MDGALQDQDLEPEQDDGDGSNILEQAENGSPKMNDCFHQSARQKNMP